ncbi:MAG: Uma2 family endonuclease [Spirulinaceae cyanobacterium]
MTRFLTPKNTSGQTLPTMYDLPSEFPEEPGLPDYFHFLQPLLLYLSFSPLNYPRERFFCGADMNVYYDPEHTLRHKRPDWFAAVGVPEFYDGKDLRLSYVTWAEVANPFVVVELLSPGTEKEDLGQTQRQNGELPTKWEVYEQILKIPYYFIFSRYTNEGKAYRLGENGYEEMAAVNRKWLVPELGLSLGIWSGEFERSKRQWLRWFTLEGELIAVDKEKIAQVKAEIEVIRERLIQAEEEAEDARERIIQARQETQEARQEAAKAKQEKEQLLAKLKELGIDPDEIS